MYCAKLTSHWLECLLQSMGCHFCLGIVKDHVKAVFWQTRERCGKLQECPLTYGHRVPIRAVIVYRGSLSVSCTDFVYTRSIKIFYFFWIFWYHRRSLKFNIISIRVYSYRQQIKCIKCHKTLSSLFYCQFLNKRVMQNFSWVSNQNQRLQTSRPLHTTWALWCVCCWRWIGNGGWVASFSLRGQWICSILRPHPIRRRKVDVTLVPCRVGLCIRVRRESSRRCRADASRAKLCFCHPQGAAGRAPSCSLFSQVLMSIISFGMRIKSCSAKRIFAAEQAWPLHMGTCKQFI